MARGINHKVKVLFVCMGNICRSPAAEGVFRDQAKKRGLAGRIHIESAGTIGYHAGDLPDKRMREAARRRGYDLCSLAKQVTMADLDTFDYILAMDRDNLFHLHSLDRDGRHAEKIHLFTAFYPEKSVNEVPDPYYGGAAGFETVLDIVEKCSQGLLEEMAVKRGLGVRD